LRTAQFDQTEKIRPIIRKWRSTYADKPRTADYVVGSDPRLPRPESDPRGQAANGDHGALLEQGAPWTAYGFGSSFNKAKARAGLSKRDLHFHDLRGTAASKFYKAGLLQRVIAEIMGSEEQSVSRIIRRYVGRAAATQAAIEQLAQGRT
jgi:integrase